MGEHAIPSLAVLESFLRVLSGAFRFLTATWYESPPSTVLVAVPFLFFLRALLRDLRALRGESFRFFAISCG